MFYAGMMMMWLAIGFIILAASMTNEIIKKNMDQVKAQIITALQYMTQKPVKKSSRYCQSSPDKKNQKKE